MIGKLAESSAGPLAGASFFDQVKTDGGKFVLVAAQLALVLLAIRLFQVENGFGFQDLLPLIFGGFAVHAWLPERWRQPFFVGLTLAGIWLLFGVVGGSWLIGIGLMMIGLAHLPAPFWLRVSLVTAVGVVLTAFRAGWMQTSWSGGIIAILGSMFMFRMALYLYDMRSEKKPATLFERLSYFFQLPNIVFPFYPIVDYITFRRTYYDRDAYEIYQKGVLWMLRGVVHLLMYRVVYYYFTPAVEEVQGLGGVVLFIVSAYLLYLRVSGLFHLIIGLMCLFGFNLPETHKRYFLASSFNDYWRRINIYWKDFMMKLFFYPVYMRVRHWGNIPALVFSTVIVFACTWILHSYQWFWLQGDFPLTTVDGVYWGVLGVLVAINSVWESVKGKKAKSLSKKGWTLQGALGLSLRTVVTFLFLGVMWSFWSSESVGEWWSVMKQVGTSGAPEWLLLLGGLAGLYVVLVALDALEAKGLSPFFEERGMSFSTVAGRTGVMALALAGIGLPQVHQRAGEQASGFISSIQETRLNSRDQDIADRGYYEGLMDAHGYTSQLAWAEEVQRPDDWKATMNSEATRPGEGLLVYELIPNFDGIEKETPFKTNQWGMRDKEYLKEKPEGVYRMAMLGASYEQGSGVTEEETYEALIETRLNAELAGSGYAGYEILNFSVGGYSPVQNLVVAEKKAFDFQPDVVAYAIHSTEKRRMLMQVERMIKQQREISYPYLSELFARIGVSHEMTQTELRRLLDPHGEEILKWSLEELNRKCNERGIPLVVLYVPTTEEIDGLDPERAPDLLRILEETGIPTLMVDEPYRGRTSAEVQLRPWDTHLSKIGHEVVAEHLYDVLLANDALLKLRTPAPAVP